MLPFHCQIISKMMSTIKTLSRNEQMLTPEKQMYTDRTTNILSLTTANQSFLTIKNAIVKLHKQHEVIQNVNINGHICQQHLRDMTIFTAVTSPEMSNPLRRIQLTATVTYDTLTDEPSTVPPPYPGVTNIKEEPDDFEAFVAQISTRRYACHFTQSECTHTEKKALSHQCDWISYQGDAPHNGPLFDLVIKLSVESYVERSANPQDDTPFMVVKSLANYSPLADFCTIAMTRSKNNTLVLRKQI